MVGGGIQSAERVRGKLLFFHCVTALLCRRRGWLGAALRLPSRCGPTLLCPRPEGAIRTGAPRRSRDAAPPSPQRGSRVRYPRASERFATRGTGRLKAPLPKCGGMTRCDRLAGMATQVVSVRCKPEGGGEIRPAGAWSHHAEACGHRAARPAGGDAGPDRALHAREGNSEGPHAGLCPAAGGIAREGGSEGCARCAARATWL